MARFCLCWVATWGRFAVTKLRRSAAIPIACNTTRRAAQRSLHSGPVSAQVWRLSSKSRSPPARQGHIAGGVEVVWARSGNSPANLYSRLPRRSGAAKAELRCRVRTFGTGRRAGAGDLHSGLARQFASRISRAGFGSESLRRCKDFARAS